MRRCSVWLALCVILLAGSVAGCGGAKEEAALLRLLRFVPDEADYREWVSFGDAAAWHESWGIPRIDGKEELDALDRQSRAYWLIIMGRQTAPGESLGADNLLAEDQRSYYGFDLFNVDRYLEAGWPPQQIAAVEFGFGAKQIADALTASGYTAEKLEKGGTLYSVRGDNVVDLHSASPSNRLGERNRVALLDGQMVLGRATGPVSDALAARRGDKNSLADNPAFRASARALQDRVLSGYGKLVGVMWLEGSSLQARLTPVAGVGLGLAPEVRQRLEELYGSKGQSLPRFDLAAFATQHAQGASHLTVALVFPAGTQAQAGAEVLAERLKTYVSVRPGESLEDRWSFEQAIAVEAEGRPVALVTMRVPDPAPTSEEEPVVNTSILSWSLLVASLDLGFLASE